MLRRFLGACISYNDFIRGRVLSGLLFLAPFIITLFVLVWIYSTVSSALEPFFVGGSGRYLPVAVVGVILLLPFTTGFLLLYTPARRVLTVFGAIVQRTPFVGSIYRVGRDVSLAFDPASQMGFNRVVQIEYPRAGMWSMGFLTATVEYEDGTTWAVVFLPTAPLPNSGWVAYVPVDEVFELDMTTGQAMQLTLSGGILTPPKMVRKRLSLDSLMPQLPGDTLPEGAVPAEQTAGS